MATEEVQGLGFLAALMGARVFKSPEGAVGANVLFLAQLHELNDLPSDRRPPRNQDEVSL